MSISWSHPIATSTSATSRRILPFNTPKPGGGDNKIDEIVENDKATDHFTQTTSINAVTTEFLSNPTKSKHEDVTLLTMNMYDMDEETDNRDEATDPILENPDPDFDRDNPINGIQEEDTPIEYATDEAEDVPIDNDALIDPNAMRAQIDTGAKVSVTNLKYALHGYKEYGENKKSPICLTGAIDSNLKINPEGYGYIRIPSENKRGFIDVKTYYSPRLTSTLMSENCILRASVPKGEFRKYNSQTIRKDFGDDESKMSGIMTITNYHRQVKPKNVKIKGVLLGGQCFTHPIIVPNLQKDHPKANRYNSSGYALKVNASYKRMVEESTKREIQLYKANKYVELAEELSTLPRNVRKYTQDIMKIIDVSVPVHAIRSRTEKMLWHQRLGHPCDEYLYNAHKFIKGIPKFERETSVLDQCPTCIQAKQSKEPKGKNSTRKATKPYEGLSIDFSFSGTRSKDDNRRKDFEGMNGETCYVMITDHFTGMKHGDTRLSKAPPTQWIRKFLSVHSPKLNGKYVHMDQGGELFHSPEIKNVFSEFGYEILPTGADNSRQNGPVERAHRTIGNGIRSLLQGAGIDMRFWPYAFYHMIRISNAIPERNRTQSPLEMSTGTKEDFTHLRTFGCRVWVRPAQGRTAKYIPNSRKGIFLGYVPHTTRNIIWYDTENHRVKIASHARFDEGMNDLPVTQIPPNVQQLQRSDDNERTPLDPQDIKADNLGFHITPFPVVITKTIKSKLGENPGISVNEDTLSKRAYISKIHDKSPLSKIFSTLKAARHKLQGAYILSINGDLVYTAEDVNRKLQQLRDQGVTEISIDLAPTPKLNAKQQGKAQNEFGLFHPNTKPDNEKNTTNDIGIMERSPKDKNQLEKDVEKFVSKRIAKEFEAGTFFGTITEKWDDSGTKRWNVKFDDDDCEDMTKKEIKKGIKLYERHKHDDPVWRDKNRSATIKKIMANITREPYTDNDTNVVDDLNGSIPSIDIQSLRAIAKIRGAMLKGKLDNEWIAEGDKYNEQNLPVEFIETVINAIQSQATTPEEQALGYFTRKKLKRLDTWPKWLAGEKKQLNQFEALGMYGKPILIPDKANSIVLRPHWQYNIKRDGTRRSRLCCNGSKKAAPLLHSIALTYSSCVEHPIQRLFLAIAASLNLKIYGGDAKDAYGHSPGPEIPTFMSIDDAYAEWYEEKYGEKIDRRKVLPVRKALQGHPESGRLWERHITGILEKMGFRSTTHDKTIYRLEYLHKDTETYETIYMLRQVDDFAMACKDETTAKKLYEEIGLALQTEQETEPPFAYLGLVKDFNGVDISQTNEYIEISSSNYIDRVMRSHGWETEPRSKGAPTSPMNKDALEQIFRQEGHKEGTREHAELEHKAGFAYRTLLGELMFCYVSCRCDIGYAITLLSKFSTSPSQYHYTCLKNVARYLRATKHWGIRYKRGGTRSDLPVGDFTDLPKREENLPTFPVDTAQDRLICFVDAAYGNDKTKRRSTTGYAFTYSGGAIVYRSKAQSVTALSSTEAELIAAVTAAKTARFIRAVLQELGFKQDEPTPIYEDNKPTIDIVNSKKPTQRSRHIDIRFFAIQDWMDNRDISMHHINGVINPADDLTKPLGWVLHARHARFMMGHTQYRDNA